MSARLLAINHDENDPFLSHTQPGSLDQLDLFGEAIRDAWLNQERPLPDLQDAAGEPGPRPRLLDDRTADQPMLEFTNDPGA